MECSLSLLPGRVAAFRCPAVSKAWSIGAGGWPDELDWGPRALCLTWVKWDVVVAIVAVSEMLMGSRVARDSKTPK